jgi:hypothetical protein
MTPPPEPDRESSSQKSSIISYGTTDNGDSESSTSYQAVHGTDFQGHQREPSSDRERRKSFIEEEQDPLEIEAPTARREGLVTWSSLPCKSQLAILTIARLSEPLVQTSLRVSFPIT